MVISPYAKKDYVSHVHYSFGSIFKTMWHIWDCPYLNQYDAGCYRYVGLFSVPNRILLLTMPSLLTPVFSTRKKPLDPLDEKFNWKAVVESPVLDNPADMERRSKEEDEEAG
jgi:hypothetical protein